MRDAIGGVFSLQIILAFVLLISGYMAYSVNYTRAFRVKNKIVNIIEEQEGYTTDAEDQIAKYITDMRYTVPVQTVNSLKAKNENWNCRETKGYCILEKTAVKKEDTPDDSYALKYYEVVTFVNIDIPVLNKFLPLSNLLQVKGETRSIYVPQ